LKRGIVIGGGLLLLLLIGGAASRFLLPGTGPEEGGPDFLERFWKRPLAPQGAPPADFTPLEASLGSEACRACHPRQFKQWQSSLHSRTMGPGVWWQFRVKTPEQVKSCMNCHAPLAEQKALAGQDLGWPGGPSDPRPDYVPADLHRKGLVCAACHVRGHRRFGPPKADALPADRAPHHGFAGREAFRNSRFCAGCHQFPDDGPSLNGKLRENTYREWRASRYADQGVTCQSCHMPDGAHRWRGIHDPAMVRKGVSASLRAEGDGAGGYRVTAAVANSGAGHKLPTYLTPKLFARLLLIGPAGDVRKRLDKAVIGWKADVEMTREIFDTRLDPGERIELSGKAARPAGSGWKVALWLDAAPQRHYERLFRYMFRQKDKMDPATQRLLETAYKRAQATRFEVLRKRVPLPP